MYLLSSLVSGLGSTGLCGKPYDDGGDSLGLDRSLGLPPSMVEKVFVPLMSPIVFRTIACFCMLFCLLTFSFFICRAYPCLLLLIRKNCYTTLNPEPRITKENKREKKKMNGIVDQQQSQVPNPNPVRKATPRKLRVNSNQSSKVKDQGADDRDGCPERDGISQVSSRPSSSPRSRARRDRKNRSKRQIAAENGEPTDTQETDNHPRDDDDAASNVSSGTSKSSRFRPRQGGRKNRSKRQIASENQQLAGAKDQAESDREEQQLRDAERELCGHNDLAGEEHSELPEDYYLSDSGRSGESRDNSEDEEYSGQGRKVRDEVRQERQHRKPQRRQPRQQSDTGMRHFNVRRADPSARPVKVERKTQQDHDREAQPDQQSSHEQNAQQSRRPPKIPGISLGEGRPVQGQGEEQEQSPNAGKEVSIKFDLNMEIEILLKAKIKGEIMVTFL